MALLKEGTKAPAFKASDASGKIWSLKELVGKWALIYFYPKDLTPGCTVEACSIRDVWGEFERLGVVVLGVSKDSVTSHEKFIKVKKLPFPLLADTEKTMMKAYKAWGKKKFMGREFEGTLRVSYLIDPKGKIARVYEKVVPKDHAGEVLRDVLTLRKK